MIKSNILLPSSALLQGSAGAQREGRTEMPKIEGAVCYERIDEHVALVTLNRPEARNAVNCELAHALDALRQQFDADDSMPVAVLAASGLDVFCAGADLRELSNSRAGISGLHTPSGGFAGFVKARRAKPWIAAVRGKAVGGGFEILLACDMIVASNSASFALPESKIGVFAGGGGAFRIAKLLPRALGNEILRTGRSIDAAYAYAFGIVNRLVEDDAVIAEALRLANEIVKCAPISVRASLEMVRASSELCEADLWEFNDAWAQRIIRTNDAKEGPRAFLEKRTPQWTAC